MDNNQADYSRFAVPGFASFVELVISTYDDNPAVLPLGEEDDRADRADARVKNCGRPMMYTDAKGNLREGTFVCGDFKLCPHCMKRRAKKYQERVEQAWQDSAGRLVITFVSEAEARSLCRGAGRDTYQRMPQEDGRILLIARSDTPNFSGIASEIGIDDLDWLALARTPIGLRPSGSLGKEQPASVASTEQPTEAVETVECNVVSLVVDFDGVNDIAAVKEIAREETMIETGHLTPRFDGEELTRCRNMRTYEYGRQLKKRGARIVGEVWRTETVSNSSYREWSVYKLSAMERAVRIAQESGFPMTDTVLGLLAVTLGTPQMFYA